MCRLRPNVIAFWRKGPINGPLSSPLAHAACRSKTPFGRGLDEIRRSRGIWLYAIEMRSSALQLYKSIEPDPVDMLGSLPSATAIVSEIWYRGGLAAFACAGPAGYACSIGENFTSLPSARSVKAATVRLS